MANIWKKVIEGKLLEKKNFEFSKEALVDIMKGVGELIKRVNSLEGEVKEARGDIRTKSSTTIIKEVNTGSSDVNEKQTLNNEDSVTFIPQIETDNLSIETQKKTQKKKIKKDFSKISDKLSEED